MGVYIKGMKLPTENQNLNSIKLRFRWDPRSETWYCFDDNVVGPDRYKEVVAVPDHGDLIDADDIPVYDDYEFPFDGIALKGMMKERPVIIKADKDGE